MIKEFEPFRQLDAELVKVARRLKILSSLAWPPSMRDEFLEGWNKGDPKLPQPPEVRAEYDEELEALTRLAKPAADHPLAKFIARTADSYRQAALLLRTAGTPAFTELSVEMYGKPTDEVTPGGLSSLKAAEHFCRTTDDIAGSCRSEAQDATLSAQEVARAMRPRFKEFFTQHEVKIVVDENLAAKAAAGAKRIRLRASALFSPNDIDQLTQHEGFVHAGTLLNGRSQPHLTCLSLGAPRTTATQEGLATVAELISNAIDLSRLRRIALRIGGIHLGLEGADFIEVFRFFLHMGQSEIESYNSTMRVFRGGDVKGKVVFTKDAVYLRGLLKTHTWLHTALAERKLDYPNHLFAGRLSWGDVEELDPFFASGLIEPAFYQPDWVKRRENLAAYLAFSSLAHEQPIHESRLSDFATRRFQPLP